MLSNVEDGDPFAPFGNFSFFLVKILKIVIVSIKYELKHKLVFIYTFKNIFSRLMTLFNSDYIEISSWEQFQKLSNLYLRFGVFVYSDSIPWSLKNLIR